SQKPPPGPYPPASRYRRAFPRFRCRSNTPPPTAPPTANGPNATPAKSATPNLPANPLGALEGYPTRHDPPSAGFLPLPHPQTPRLSKCPPANPPSSPPLVPVSPRADSSAKR